MSQGEAAAAAAAVCACVVAVEGGERWWWDCAGGAGAGLSSCSPGYNHLCHLFPSLLSCRSYAFAFGDPNPNADGTFSYHNPFIGHRYFVQLGLPRGYGVPPMNANYVQWFFQFTFASTSATIVRCGVHVPMFAFCVCRMLVVLPVHLCLHLGHHCEVRQAGFKQLYAARSSFFPISDACLLL